MRSNKKWIGAAFSFAAIVALSTAQVPPQGQPKIQLSPQALKQVNLKRFNPNFEVLKPEAFQANFGDNVKIPRTSQSIRALSKKLFSREGRNSLNEECAEQEFGELFAALQNPAISDDDRNAVDGDADAVMPAFNRNQIFGHFKFYWTDNNANAQQNVTLADVQNTANVMNAAWDIYVANFKKPKHYVSAGKELVDVKVYDLGASLYGVTNSAWNHIELNSWAVVKNACRRKTTPVHELFHRVEYSYGYVTGTAGMKWAVEATASWSQKYLAQSVGDYVGRMNTGLGSPTTSLTARSYDACHWWVYVGERIGNEKNFIKTAWANYVPSGKNMVTATDNAIKALKPGHSFNSMLSWWQFANFQKDFNNSSVDFDYTEDETVYTCGGTSFGPLGSVPTTNAALTLGTQKTVNASVSPQAASYYSFTVPATATKIDVNLSAASNNFGFAATLGKGNKGVTYVRTPAGGVNSLVKTFNFTAGTVDKVTIVVMGIPNGGAATIKVKAYN